MFGRTHIPQRTRVRPILFLARPCGTAGQRKPIAETGVRTGLGNDMLGTGGVRNG